MLSWIPPAGADAPGTPGGWRKAEIKREEKVNLRGWFATLRKWDKRGEADMFLINRRADERAKR
jgi:hypothetical protein